MSDPSVEDIINEKHGIVVTSRATRYTLAHEIGHAFGMDDIYSTNSDVKESGDPLFSISNSEMASYCHMRYDWNGGCNGHGSGGVRYYRQGAMMKDIVSRMLMLGLVGEVDEGRDIANGDVYGVGFTNGVSRIWFKGDVNVAAPWIYRNPVHE